MKIDERLKVGSIYVKDEYIPGEGNEPVKVEIIAINTAGVNYKILDNCLYGRIRRCKRANFLYSIEQYRQNTGNIAEKIDFVSETLN